MKLRDADEPPLPDALWESLRRDEPDARAVDDAFRRFVAPRPPRLVHFGLLRWLGAGFVVGWGVVFAATGKPLFGAGSGGAPQVANSGPARTQPSAGPTAAAPAPSAPSAIVALPEAREAPRPQSPPVSRARDALIPETVAARARLDPKWQRVAEALRTQDHAAARDALAELEAAGTPADREAASLAAAQILVAQGLTAEARARLEPLSTRARSALVRDKATSLLAEMISKADRSSGAPPATQRP